MKYAIVTWYDSSRGCQDWTVKDDYRLVSPHAIVSVGFILHEDINGITLVQNISCVGTSDEQYCNTMTIPRCCIASSRAIDDCDEDARKANE